MLCSHAMAKISRRKFLGLSALALPTVLSADARMTPRLRVTTLPLSDRPKCRFVHFCDFHHAGDSEYADEVVTAINRLRPDFVCFTGDLVEDRAFLGEALGFIGKISVPVYGVPGNHDYTSGAAASEFERLQRNGRRLANESRCAPVAIRPRVDRHGRDWISGNQRERGEPTSFDDALPRHGQSSCSAPL